MYDLIDRPVADLPRTDRFLLDAMRIWVHALTLAGQPAEAVSTRFIDGGDAFDTVMRRLDAGSVGTLTFQRPCHAVVEETEAVMLSVWRMLRVGAQAEALATMRLMARPAASAGIVAAMAAVVR